MALNLSNFAPMLKTMYTKDKVQNLVYKKQAFLASLPKSEEFFGESKTVPLIFGNPQGRSADFSTAQGNKGNTQSAKFIVTRAKDYGLISIDNETIKASQNDAGAFLQARTVEIDGMFQNLTNTMGVDLFGDGSGVRAKIDGVTDVSSASGVITLLDAQDIVKFEVGMKLQFSATQTGGSVRAGYAFVKSVDRRAGTFVVSASAGGAAGALNGMITSPANTDYIYAAGDYDAKIKGLAAWLPYGGPSATTFFGLNRTVDATRMAGQWDDLSSLPIEEALIEGHRIMEREGASIDKIWISLSKMADLNKALGTKVQYIDMHVGPEIAFRGIKLQTGDGVVEVFADRNCGKSDCYMLQSNTWKLETLGSAPQILNMDSLESLREATADAIEIRLGWYGQLICNAPGYNGHFHI